MTRSKWSLMLQAGIAGLLLVSCAPDTVEDSETTSSESVSVSSSAAEMQTFTLEELSQYTGKDGQPGYVAVDGVVYDVTNVETWKDGEHQMGLTAGNELSEEINSSPHGKQVLEGLPIVGEFVE